MSKPMQEEVGHFRREAAGVALTVVGVLILYSLAWRPDAPIPGAICWFLAMSVGHGAYVVPIAALAIGILTVLSAQTLRLRHSAVGLGILFLVFLTVLHLQTAAGDEWARAAIERGGGVLGAAVAWALRRVLGQVGAYIVLGGVTAVALLHMSEVETRDVLARVGAWTRDRAADARRWLLGRAANMPD
ncbi:MAG: DNA translocase FtsK 4TM domain-containing protein, partial [Armatimonadota bacterium]